MSKYFQKTILLVDDDPLFVEVIDYGLRKAGYRVLTAKDGREAVKLFNSTIGIDLVILDMEIPVLDGSQAYFLLKHIDPDLKLIVTTGHYEDARVRQVLADGWSHGFLRKPFRIKDLVREVEKYFTK